MVYSTSIIKLDGYIKQINMLMKMKMKIKIKKILEIEKYLVRIY